MSDTPILDLPEIAEGVASQATLHNEALRLLEARLVRALSRTTTAPPGSPAEGDSYIIPAGTWGGSVNQVASFVGGAWSYYTPIEGVRLWVNDTNGEYVYDGAAWTASGGGAGGDVVGPASSTDGHFATYDGVTGKLLKDTLALDTDGTLAANSDTRVASQKAVKAYVTTSVAGGGGGGSSITGTTGAAGGNATATGGTSTTSANAGGAVVLTGGTPGATGHGGAVTITAANGGASGGNGGAVTLKGGDSQSGTTLAGGVSITGGAVAAFGTAGPITITGGQGGPSASAGGGAITVQGGPGGGASGGPGGEVLIRGGAATVGNGGNVTVIGANGGGSGGAAGGVAITGGNGTFANAGGVVNITGGIGQGSGNGGNVTVSAGAAAGAGTPGTVTLKNGATTGLTVKAGTAVLSSYTVAGLPAAATAGAGAMAYATDIALAVVSNGTTWSNLGIVVVSPQSATGTAVDFTGLPAGVKQITVMFLGVQKSTTANFQIVLGTSAGFGGSYQSFAWQGGATDASATSTTGLVLTAGGANTLSWSGSVDLSQLSPTAWVSRGGVARNDGVVPSSAGYGVIPATLDRVRVTIDGTATFTTGSIGISYQF